MIDNLGRPLCAMCTRPMKVVGNADHDRCVVFSCDECESWLSIPRKERGPQPQARTAA